MQKFHSFLFPLRRRCSEEGAIDIDAANEQTPRVDLISSTPSNNLSGTRRTSTTPLATVSSGTIISRQVDCRKNRTKTFPVASSIQVSTSVPTYTLENGLSTIKAQAQKSSVFPQVPQQSCGTIKPPPITAFFLRENGMEMMDDHLEIYQVLRDYGTNQHVTCLGLTYLREILCNATSSSEIVLTRRNWIAHMQAFIEFHKSGDVVLQVVRTLMSFASISNPPQQIMIEKGCLPLLLDCMRTYRYQPPEASEENMLGVEKLQALCCATLECLAFSSSVKSKFSIVQLVDAIYLSMLIIHTNHCQSRLARALFQLVQKSSSGRQHWQELQQRRQNSKHHEKMTSVFLHITEQEKVDVETQYAALCLLYQCLQQRDSGIIQGSIEVNSDLEHQVQNQIVYILNKFDSVGMKSLALGCLVLSLRYANFPTTKIQSLSLHSELIDLVLEIHPDNEVLAYQAMTTLLYLFKRLTASRTIVKEGNDQGGKLADTGPCYNVTPSRQAKPVLNYIIQGMLRFPDSPEIANCGAYGYVLLTGVTTSCNERKGVDCATRTEICRDGCNKQYKSSPMNSNRSECGTVMHVILQAFYLHVVKKSRTNLKKGRASIAAAFALLCESNPSNAHNLATTTTILIVIDEAVRQEYDLVVLASLFRIYASLLPHVQQHPWDNKKRTDRFQTKTVKLSILQSVIQVAKDFPMASILHMEALRLWDTIYRLVPFRGMLGQVTAIQLCGQQIGVIKTHSVKEVDQVYWAIQHSQKNNHILAAYCITLSSFFAPCCNQDRELAPDAVALALHTVPLIYDTITIYQKDKHFVHHAMHTLWVLSSFGDLFVINSNWSKILMTLANSHHSSADVGIIISSIFLTGQSRKREILWELSTLEFFVQMNRCEFEGVALLGCRCLSSIVKGNLHAIDTLSRVQNVSGCLIIGLESHSKCIEIQECIFSIIASLAAASTRDQIHELANCGGLKAMLFSMNKHFKDVNLTKLAARALIAVIEEANTDIFWAHRYSTCEALINGLESVFSDIEALTSVIDAMCCSIARDEEFKILLGPVLPALTRSIYHHLNNASIQVTLCHLLESFAGIKENEHYFREETIVLSIISMLLAHPEHQELVVKLLEIMSIIVVKKSVSSAFYDCGQKYFSIFACLMRMHFSRPQIFTTILALLKRMLQLDIDNANTMGTNIAPLTDSLLDIVIKALQCFASNESIVRNSVMLLDLYSQDETSLAKIQQAHKILLFSDEFTRLYWNCDWKENWESIRFKISRSV